MSNMLKEITGDTEIRKLPPLPVFRLSQILDSGDDWKQLMSVIPIAGNLGNPPKYTVEHMKLIETAGRCQKQMFTDILLDEWGTSGKCRPTVSVLLQCLLKAELYRAADFVAVELLKQAPPTRPENGPAALVKCPTSIRSQMTPSAPPAPSEPPQPPRAPTPSDPTVFVETDSYEVVQLRYTELEAGTDGFSDLRLLGGGGFGSVYLANLPRLGAVAVKRFHQTGITGDPQHQFRNEVQVLSQLSHPHLLPLLGYSDDGLSLCLAYKYMKNGSLLDRLACKNSKTPLPWKTRLEIALGSARGLSHLHSALQSPLVHRDVKSANILLDDNFTPKLGDFGLVRLGSSGIHTHSVAITTTIIGTSAYMAPEAQRGDVSVKMDVFSFGVVLLELLTGLPPLDENREGNDLITHVDGVDDKDSLVDSKAGDWPPHIVTSLFELTEQCLLDKRRRPLIAIVIDKLETLL